MLTGMYIIDEFDLDNFRELIVRAENTIVIIHGPENYELYGSEGTTIKYLQSLCLCNNKNISTTECNRCQKSFTWSCMLYQNQHEHSISTKLLPSV